VSRDVVAHNTAIGDSALQDDVNGYYNTAVGSGALLRTVASNNTGVGLDTLIYDTTGANNTASGGNALFSNTTASENTADGFESLYDNTTGEYNTASGAYALYGNLTGAGNTAIGESALNSNTIGGNNIAIGYYAGANLTTGYRNIDIGNVGAKGEAGTIRIGTAGQHFATYVAGIDSARVTGSAVYISSAGQLGVLASSERYKTAIEPMAQRTEKLARLRPVTFHLKTDPKGDVQYGLIAEEVAKVYPELVIRDEEGQVEGVRYEELAPMLLNELQVQQRRSEIQAKKQAEQLEALQLRIAELERSMQGRATEK
jgi:Chaperone of endosialidase